MQEQKPTPSAAAPETPVSGKRPYTPPEATFVPLKMEERLLACLKISNTGTCATSRQKS
jgi:hypothetical protein